jgi:hypothetical protein
MKTAWNGWPRPERDLDLLLCPRRDPARVSRGPRLRCNRDASAFFDRGPDFQAADGSTRADAEALLRRYFAGYEILDVIVSDVTIEKADNAARVRFRAELSGQPRKIGGLDSFLPRTSSYDFDMRLTPEAGKWKVAWAEWGPRS